MAVAADSGRAGMTGNREDLFLFKVPGLRNVEHTGPYFDHGLVTDLGEAVRLMARYQRGMALTEQDVAEILVWLKTLTGTPPKDLVPPAGDR